MRKLVDDTKKSLTLRNPGKFTKPLLDSVEADISLNSIKTERNFRKLVVEVRSTDKINYSVKPNIVTISVSGPNSTIRSLTKSDILPYLRLESQDPGTYRVRVKVDLPPKVNLISISPESLNVEIKSNS